MEASSTGESQEVNDKQAEYTENKIANHKERLHSDPEYRDRQWEYQLIHKFGKYGLARGQRARMELEQGGLCAICRKRDSKGRKLAVDHSHGTDQVRALLCRNCNVGIGHFSEDTQRDDGRHSVFAGAKICSTRHPAHPN